MPITAPISTTLLLALLALITPSCTTAAVVFDDDFGDGDTSGSPSAPGFWKLQSLTGDNGVFENSSYLTLFASRNAYTYAGLNSGLDPRLDFFQGPVTIAVESFMLGFKNIADKEAVFRLSINSSQLRQNVSPQSVTLRFSPGSVALGFKTADVPKMNAEDLHGTEKGGVCYATFAGNVTGFSLTLDPRPQPDATTYTLVLLTDGPLPVLTRTGRLALRRSAWSAAPDFALVLEARRNAASVADYSYVSASLGRMTITRP